MRRKVLRLKKRILLVLQLKRIEDETVEISTEQDNEDDELFSANTNTEPEAQDIILNEDVPIQAIFNKTISSRGAHT